MEYPLSKFHFEVTWGGARIGFTEVSGLDMEFEVIEYREGNNRESQGLKMPGRKKFSNITLKRGVFPSDNDYYAWLSDVSLDDAKRRSLTISLLNDAGDAVVVWSVKEAWPVKIQSTDLKADANEVAIESMELAHQGFTIENN